MSHTIFLIIALVTTGIFLILGYAMSFADWQWFAAG